MMKKLVMASVMLSMLLVFSCATTGGGSGGGGGATGEAVAGNWEWIASDDSNDKGTSTIEMIVAEEEIDGETVTTYTFFGEVTDATQYGLAQAEIQADEATKELLKTAKAISFKLLADGRNYVLEAPISSVTDWGFHRYNVKTTDGEVMEYNVQMRMFVQPAWATAVRFNLNNLTGFRLQTVNAAEGGVGPFKFKIWDLKIYQ